MQQGRGLPPGVQVAGGSRPDGQRLSGQAPQLGGYGQRQGGLGQKQPGAAPSATSSYRDVKADEAAVGTPSRAARLAARLEERRQRSEAQRGPARAQAQYEEAVRQAAKRAEVEARLLGAAPAARVVE